MASGNMAIIVVMLVIRIGRIRDSPAVIRRNLLYVSVINSKGEILEQKSLNVINDVDYHEKLDVREKDRTQSRKTWTKIKGIKDLKEGYVSQAVHEVVKMAINNNAIIAMENLNSGFKRSRTKFEKQI